MRKSRYNVGSPDGTAVLAEALFHFRRSLTVAHVTCAVSGRWMLPLADVRTKTTKITAAMQAVIELG